MAGFSATMPGILPFITAAPGDAPGSTLQAGTPAYTTGADGKPVAVDTTTTQRQLGPSTSSSTSTSKAGPEDKAAFKQFGESNEAAKAALAQPTLPGYTIDPETGLEMKPPEQPQEPVAAVPADMQIPIGKFASVPAGRMPGMAANADGTVSPAQPVAAPVAHTLAQQKDVNEQYKAAQELKLAQEEREEFARDQQRRQEFRANFQKQMESDESAIAKARKALSDPGDKGFLNEVLQVFAQALGGYSSGLLGGPNKASAIIQAKQDRDFAKKKLELEAATEAMSRHGTSQAQANKIIDDQWAKFLAGQKLKLVEIQKKADVLLPRFPNAQAEANKVMTQEMLKFDTKVAEIAKGREEVHSQSTRSMEGDRQTTVTPGAASLGGKTGNWTAKEAEIDAKEYAKTLRDFQQVVKENPKGWKAFQEAQKAEHQAIAADQTKWGELRKTGQAWGMVPVAIEQRFEGLPPDVAAAARKINAGYTPLVTLKARESDPNGTLNDSSYVRGSKSLNTITATPQEIAAKAEEYAAKMDRKAQAAASMNANFDARQAQSTAPAAPAQPRPAAAPAPTLIGNELKKLTLTEIERYGKAKKVLNDKNHPKYNDAQNVVRALEAKARGGQ